MERWYVARHKTAAADWALLNLRHQGFITLWPTFKQRVIRRNKAVIVKRPIFSGYLFIRFDIHDWHWQAINYTSGIIRLLPTHAEEPIPVPDEFIAALATREPSAPVIVEVLQRFHENEIVKILSGAFRGWLGKVISSGPRSTRLSVAAFGGRDTVVTVQTGDLIAAEEGAPSDAAAGH
jgi:transcriptional antiterminator RfaH